MFATLKTHPFPVEAFFKSSLVMTFALPKEQVQTLIPPCLDLDVFEGQFAFVAIAFVQTTGLRPKGFPVFFGNSFFLAGYRVFVRFTTQAGKRLRGLYILKSETDKKRMQFFGNLFTHYSYTTTDIHKVTQGDITEISSEKSGFSVKFEHSPGKPVSLPKDSPFQNWKEARRFAGPLPFTFSYIPNGEKVLIIEGVRQHWTPVPVRVIDYRVNFLNDPIFKNASLANAFVVENIPYHWKKGRIEPWQKEKDSRES